MKYRIEHSDFGEVDLEVTDKSLALEDLMTTSEFSMGHEDRIEYEDKFIAGLKYLAWLLLMENDLGHTKTPKLPEVCPPLDGSRGIKFIGMYRNEPPDSYEFEVIEY